MQDHDFVVGQDFLLTVKKYWTTEMYPALKSEYESSALARGSGTTADHVAEMFVNKIDYQLFAWFERHLQKMKYSGPFGLVPYHRERQEALTSDLLKPLESEALQINEAFRLPNYYTAIDIHQQPGGVWSEAVSGMIYERGARTTTPMLDDNHRDLHYRFADSILQGEAASMENPEILDMGCGFGKSTRPFWELFGESRITCIDLAAPCLKFAASEAARATRGNMIFRQADSRSTGCDPQSFDIVTSTMLLHEMPNSARHEMFAESWRLLRPGGIAVHLDFWLLKTPFERFVFEGHSKRNNEPFMKALFDTDLPRDLADAGFEKIEISAFGESAEIDPDNWPFWRFPWTRIAMRKPAKGF